MKKGAIFSLILGLVGLVIGIFAMTPYNKVGPYDYIFAGGLPFALLYCGLGILFVILGLWLNTRKA